MSTPPANRATFRDVFAVPEFRALWASQILSVGGDRLALVALTLLVFDRTHSPLLAAVAYAAGYIPWVIGGLLFSGLADRLPRRTVMIACDVIRAVTVSAMLIPGMPIVALVVLLYATTLAQPPFEAARSAIFPDVLEGPLYPLGAAVLQTTFAVGVIVGAAAGGVTVALVGARTALVIDVLTFVASGLLVRFGTRARTAPAKSSKESALAALGKGTKLVFGNKALRTLVLMGWLCSIYEIPQGIAAPFARSFGGGAVAAGLVIASGSVGAVLVTPIFTKKIGPLTRLRWMGPMAVCACAVLSATALSPYLAVSLAIFAFSGTFGIYQIAANTAFVERVPNERRSQAFGLANTGLLVGQGVAFTVAGAASEVVHPSTVIALAGGIGAVAACGLAVQWRGMSPVVGRHAARHLRGRSSLTRQAPIVVRSR